MRSRPEKGLFSSKSKNIAAAMLNAPTNRDIVTVRLDRANSPNPRKSVTTHKTRTIRTGRGNWLVIATNAKVRVRRMSDPICNALA